jgi:hypothetical protein
MSIDPTTGGHTVVQGGHPPTILCGGYIGSSILGGLFILGGFDTLVAKILSFVAGVGLIAPLSLVRDKLYVLPLPVPQYRKSTTGHARHRTILLTLSFEGALIGFWFIDHACAIYWLYPRCMCP